MADLDVNEEEAFAQSVAEAGLSDAKPDVVEETKAEAEERVDTPAQAAEAEEYFPGYASLPEESKQLIRGSLEAAKKTAEYQHMAGKAEADRRAVVARLAPTQRELEAARKKLQEFEAKQSVSSRSSAREKLEKFREQYPDEGEVIAAVSSQFESYAEQAEREKAELVQRLSALEGNIRLQTQELERTRQRESEISALRNEHPDYLEIDQDPEFKAWLQAVGPQVKELLMDGKASSTSFVLHNFKRDREYARLLQASGTASPNTPAKKPLARSVADPNPTTRRATAFAHSNSAGSLDGEDKFSADLELARAAGFDV